MQLRLQEGGAAAVAGRLYYYRVRRLVSVFTPHQTNKDYRIFVPTHNHSIANK